MPFASGRQRRSVRKDNTERKRIESQIAAPQGSLSLPQGNPSSLPASISNTPSTSERDLRKRIDHPGINDDSPYCKKLKVSTCLSGNISHGNGEKDILDGPS